MVRSAPPMPFAGFTLRESHGSFIITQKLYIRKFMMPVFPDCELQVELPPPCHIMQS